MLRLKVISHHALLHAHF